MSGYVRPALFAAVSILLTVWLGLRIAGIDRGADRYELTARFADATSLKPADPVKLAGVQVGRVSSVRLDRGVAEVVFTVDKSVRLPVDSVVAIRSQDLLGRRLLRLEPGSASAMLADGETIERTKSAVELGALVNELGPLLEAVRPERVNTLVNALNEALEGNRDTVTGLTLDLATLLDTLASRAGTIDALVQDYGILSAELADRDVQVQKLIDNLVRLTETFAASESVLADALDTVPGVTEDLRVLLVDRADDVDALVADLAVIGSDIRGQLDDVDAIAAGLPESLANLFSTVDDGEFVNINFNCVSETPPPCPHPDVGDEEPLEEGELARILARIFGLESLPGGGGPAPPGLGVPVPGAGGP